MRPKGPESPLAPCEPVMRNVVCVEDDANAALQIEFSLSHFGFAIETFADGITGWQRIIGPPRPDAVILDLMLPGLDGLEIIERVRAHPTLSGLPILVLSGGEAAEDRSRAMAQGASAFLEKPIDPGELGRLIAELIEPAKSGA